MKQIVARIKPNIFFTEWVCETFGYYKYEHFKDYTLDSFSRARKTVFDVVISDDDNNYQVKMSKIIIKYAGFFDLMRGGKNITYLDVNYTKQTFRKLFDIVEDGI